MTPVAWYNEIDPFAAQWLRNLIDAGHIAPGVDGIWHDADWPLCRDGKFRQVKPGLKPLVNGFAGRVGQRRACENAICAPVAQAFMDSIQ